MKEELGNKAVNLAASGSLEADARKLIRLVQNNSEFFRHLLEENAKIEAEKESKKRVVESLLSTRKDINNLDKNEKFKLLVYALCSGDYDEVDKLMQKQELNLNQYCGINLDETLLVTAIEMGYSQIAVRLLQEPQIDVNMSSGLLSHTPLIAAAEKGYSDIVALLLANPKTMVNYKDIGFKTALEYASENGHDVVVGQLLSASGIEINKLTLQNTHFCPALITAAENGRDVVVGQLLNDPRVVVGSVALSRAAAEGHIKVVEQLLGVMQKQEIAVDPIALAMAARGGSFPVVARLLKVPGINLSTVTRNGTNLTIGGEALAGAIENNHVRMASLLLRAGVSIDMSRLKAHMKGKESAGYLLYLGRSLQGSSDETLSCEVAITKLDGIIAAIPKYYTGHEIFVYVKEILLSIIQGKEGIVNGLSYKTRLSVAKICGVDSFTSAMTMVDMASSFLMRVSKITKLVRGYNWHSFLSLLMLRTDEKIMATIGETRIPLGWRLPSDVLSKISEFCIEGGSAVLSEQLLATIEPLKPAVSASAAAAEPDDTASNTLTSSYSP